MGKGGGGGQSGASKALMIATNQEQRAQKVDAIDYIKQLESSPLGIRGDALGQLSGIYGVGGQDRTVNSADIIGSMRDTFGGMAGGQTILADLGHMEHNLQNSLGEFDVQVPEGMNPFEALINQISNQPQNWRTKQALAHSDVINNIMAKDFGDVDLNDIGIMPRQTTQQDLINRAEQSPLYGAIMGGRKMGEESILRNQAMTGGLRSGNTQEALYDYNTQLQNRALLSSYNEQLAGLGGLAGAQGMPTQLQPLLNQVDAPVAMRGEGGGGGLGGFAGGAMSGAAAGMSMGPWGAAAGGVIGGLGGLFG